MGAPGGQWKCSENSLELEIVPMTRKRDGLWGSVMSPSWELSAVRTEHQTYKRKAKRVRSGSSLWLETHSLCQPPGHMKIQIFADHKTLSEWTQTQVESQLCLPCLPAPVPCLMLCREHVSRSRIRHYSVHKETPGHFFNGRGPTRRAWCLALLRANIKPVPLHRGSKVGSVILQVTQCPRKQRDKDRTRVRHGEGRDVPGQTPQRRAGDW